MRRDVIGCKIKILCYWNITLQVCASFAQDFNFILLYRPNISYFISHVQTAWSSYLLVVCERQIWCVDWRYRRRVLNWVCPSHRYTSAVRPSRLSDYIRQTSAPTSPKNNKVSRGEPIFPSRWQQLNAGLAYTVLPSSKWVWRGYTRIQNQTTGQTDRQTNRRITTLLCTLYGRAEK